MVLQTEWRMNGRAQASGRGSRTLFSAWCDSGNVIRHDSQVRVRWFTHTTKGRGLALARVREGFAVVGLPEPPIRRLTSILSNLHSGQDSCQSAPHHSEAWGPSATHFPGQGTLPGTRMLWKIQGSIRMHVTVTGLSGEEWALVRGDYINPAGLQRPLQRPRTERARLSWERGCPGQSKRSLGFHSDTPEPFSVGR